jgi:hypothetical protein
MVDRFLVLFPNAWDRRRFDSPVYEGVVEFLYEGRDLFSFPGSVQLLTFDAMGWARDIADEYRDAGLTGVLSSDEYIGAIIAAVIARRLGLPGTDPAAIVRAQHKFYSRVAQRAAVPEATPDFELVPLTGVRDFTARLPYPFFVKPVKGTFSVFADKVADHEALQKHLGFSVFERLLLRRVTRPFNDLLLGLTEFEHDADHFIGEQLVTGDQVTVDGFAWDGEVQVMGITDSVMFEDTHTFERFEYPSRLPEAVQTRMEALTRRVVAGLGFRQGQFNVEFFYDWTTDAIRIIEINPRLSYQFADLFEYVDGSNSYDVLLDLSRGRRPRFEKGGGGFAHSASFVMRTFKGRRLKSVPSEADQAEFRDRYDEATITVYGKPGTSMKSEMKALGSYRQAIVNVAAQSLLELFAIHQDAIEQLPFQVQ